MWRRAGWGAPENYRMVPVVSARITRCCFNSACYRGQEPAEKGPGTKCENVSRPRQLAIARLATSITVGRCTSDKGCFGPRCSIARRYGTSVAADAIQRIAAAIVDWNPRESEGFRTGKGGSPSPPGHRGGDPALIPARQQPAALTPVTLLPPAPPAAQLGGLTGRIRAPGSTGGPMAHQSLPVTPNPPSYFPARRIRANLAITVPASDVPQAAGRQRGALPPGNRG
jgi:hypothetical protein